MKETRKLDSGGSTATVSSPGPTKKQERNRHMSEPTKKATEQPSRSVSSSSHTQPTSPSSASKVSSSTTTTTTTSEKTQTQHMNLSKLELVQPAMTTDQETGMRKLVEQTASNEMPPISPQLQQQQHESPKVKKPLKISVATSSETSVSLPSTPTEGGSSGSSSASSSSTPTPVPQRKGKGVRKSGGGKSQKTTSVLVTTSKPVSSQTTPTPTEPVSAPVTVVPPGETVQDQLERKESDGSLGSTDSESTSSSNSDKSEKDETNVGKTDVEPDPPLAKDQGTGQTIPLLLAQEEFLLSKCKPSPDDESPTSPTEGGSGNREDGAERDGGEGEVQQREKETEKKEKLPLLPTPRAVGRSKKKLRQQQKKEEKLRRRERERERQKDVEEKKKENVHTPPEVQERPHSLAHSLSLDDGEGPQAIESPTKNKKTVATSPKKAKRLETKTAATKADKSPGRSRTAPAKVTIPSRPPTSPPSSASSPSPPAHPTTRSLSKEDAEDSDESHESDRLSHTWAGHELEDMKDSPEPSSPHIQSEPAKSYSRENSEDGTDRQSDGAHLSSSSSHPMEAIPISALRAMRAKGAKQTRAEEEGGGGTMRPLPTVVKKSGMSRKAKDVEKLPPRMARLTEKTAMMPPAVPPQTELKPSPHKKNSIPKIIADDDVSTEGTPALEPANSEQLLLGKLKSSHMPPTSPHEIATTLLKKRKGKGEGRGRGGSGRGGNSDPHNDHEGSDEGDEGKLQTLDEEEEEEEEGENLSGKVLWAGDSETSPHKRQMRHLHYKTAPTTLSLDAEPFYPSSDYPRGKHARSHPHPHVHTDTPYAPPGSRRQLNSSPSAFTSPEEIPRSFERNYRVREILPPQHLSLHAQHLRHHGNTLTPSPPPSSFPLHSEHPPPYYHEGRHGGGIDSSDFPRHSRGPPPDMSAYEISPEEYYSPAPTPTRRVSEGVPHGQRSSRMVRSSMLYDEPLYPGSLRPHSHHHNHPQHAAAYEAAAAAHQHRREHAQMMSRGSPNPLWDQHSPYPYTPQEEEMAQIVRMRQHRLAKLIARQCSVDALSPLGHQLPLHPRPARSTLYSADTPTSNLWDPAYLDSGAYAHQGDDAFLSDFHQPRHHQRQPQPQEHAVGGVPLQQPRRRRYSSDNELGGELVPDLLQTPSSPSHVSSSGLNKAPGAAFSGMVGARRVTAREQELWADNLEVKAYICSTSLLYSLFLAL